MCVLLKQYTRRNSKYNVLEVYKVCGSIAMVHLLKTIHDNSSWLRKLNNDFQR